MAVGELIVSLLAETGSFETDTKRAGDQLVKLEKIVKQLQKTMSESYQGSENFVGPLQPNKMRPVVDNVENLNRAVQKSQGSFRSANQVIQNTSYQITDFVVQVQGGVSAMRAFSQQAPQFLGAFGPTGAALGVVAALGGAFIPMIAEAIGASKSLEDTQKALDSALSNVAQTSQTFDMGNIIKQFNDADAIVRKGIISLIEYRRTAVELAAQENARSLQDQLKGIAAPGFLSRALGNFEGANLGIDATIAKDFFAEVRSGTTEASILSQKYGVELLKGNDTAKKLAETLNKVAMDTQSAANASSAMSKFLQQAQSAGEKGIIPTGGGKADKAKPIKEQKSDMDLYIESLQKANTQFEMLGEKRQYLDSLKDSPGISPEVWQKFSDDLDRAAGGMQKLENNSMKLAQTFEQAFGSALQQGVAGVVDILFEANKSFGEFAASFVKSIAKMITQLLILKAIEMSIKSFGGTGGNVQVPTTTPLPNANGNIYDSGLKAFANGGTFTNSIVSRPTMFAYGGAFGGQAGVMGEAGPEAIVPLKRTSTGQLGVQATQPNVTINIKNEAGGDGYQATATTRKNDSGFDVDILVRKALTNDIRNNGPMSQTLSATYGLSRRTR